MKYPACTWSSSCKYSPVYILKRADTEHTLPIGLDHTYYVCKHHAKMYNLGGIYERTEIHFKIYSIISLFPFNHRNLIDERSKFDNFIGLNSDNNRPT